MRLKDIMKELIAEHQPDYICEGLIKTYRIEDSVEVMNKRFNNKHYRLSIRPTKNNGFSVSFNNKTHGNDIDLTDVDLDHIIKSASMLGYYPSTYVNNKDLFSQEKFDVSIVEKILNLDLYQIIFQPRFKAPVEDNTLPDYLYHVTPKKYEEKILKKGFDPRSKNKFEAHPERVYFAVGLDNITELIRNKKFLNDDEKEFVIFRLDVKKLISNPNNTDIFFYKDDSFKDKAYYTVDNISPRYIEVIKRFNID